MPDNRRIQGPEESQNPLLFLKADEKAAREKKDLLDSNGRRTDGRKPEELRPIYLKTGLNPRATGSAYIELASTKVMCTIYGPKEPQRKEDVQLEGRLTCEFKFAPFSCPQRRDHQQDQEEKDFTVLIAQALSPAVRLETFPKLQLELNILVLENGGNALSAALLCASIALATCGVRMNDLPVAASVVWYQSTHLVDPSLVEEETVRKLNDSSCGHMTVVYLPSKDELTALKQNGCMQPDELMAAIDACIESCLRLKQRMKDVLCT